MLLPQSLVPSAPVWSVTLPKLEVISFSIDPAAIAPATCAAQNIPASTGVMPRRSNTPRVTAGLT